MNITVSVQVREPTGGELRAQELLKEATSKHDSKDLTGAIACLRDAYGLLEQSPLSYPVATYLRLPLYLQKAGCFDEAMESFAFLLKGVTTKVARDFWHQDGIIRLSLVAMDRDIIYDKMRVACKREKKVKLVALYGLLSLASRGEGLYYQKRKSELRTVKSKATWHACIEELLAPKELKGFRKETLDECLLFAVSCTEDAFKRFEEKLTSIFT